MLIIMGSKIELAQKIMQVEVDGICMYGLFGFRDFAPFCFFQMFLLDHGL